MKINYFDLVIKGPGHINLILKHHVIINTNTMYMQNMKPLGLQTKDLFWTKSEILVRPTKKNIPAKLVSIWP